MNENYVITIGREYGSGGREIGCKLAEKLAIRCYDKEILNIVAKEKGISEELLEKEDEHRANSLLHPGGHFISGASAKDLPAFGNFGGSRNDKIFLAQSQIIESLASKESCILIGRCADYILRDHRNVLRIFVQAPKKIRIQRISEKYNKTYEDARKDVEHIDRIRRAYYQYYTDDKWGGRSSKDLVINSACLGIDATVDFIAEFIEKRFK